MYNVTLLKSKVEDFYWGLVVKLTHLESESQNSKKKTSKANTAYWMVVVAVMTMLPMIEPVWAGTTIWAGIETMTKTLYAKVLLITTPILVLTLVVAAFMYNSGNQKAAESGKELAKRALITYGAINCMGFIINAVKEIIPAGSTWA